MGTPWPGPPSLVAFGRNSRSHLKTPSRAQILRWGEFKAYLHMPDTALDWKKSPWLHVCYNRFSMKYVENPDHFLSVVKRIKLKSRSDLARLVNMGSNPLEEMLGPDPDWH